MGRKAKHKWNLDEFLDSARDHIGKMLDNMTIKDVVYIICWISGTILIYNTSAAIKTKILISPQEFLTRSFTPFWAKKGFQEKGLDIDWNIFLVSMVGSYALLKTDLGDVESAIGKLQTALGATL